MIKTNKNQKTKQSSKLWIWILAGLLVIAVGVIIGTQIGQNSTVKLPETVTVQDAQQRFADGAFLLDVREQSEWDTAHVDGAVLIPLGELPNRVSELPANQDILIICRSGNRSAQARDYLRSIGMNNTTSISGGINAWMTAGLPVITGN